MLIAVAMALNIVFISVLILFSFSQKYQLEKERAEKLEDINKIKDEFMNDLS
jgi:translation initiation factor 2B subunit (eIF-2B alpha/beta/delta family)